MVAVWALRHLREEPQKLRKTLFIYTYSRALGLGYAPNLGGWAPGTGCRPAYGPAPVDGTSRNIPGLRTQTGVGKGLTHENTRYQLE